MTASTLPEMLVPLMDGATVKLPYCAVCGARGHLEQHHVVRRGAGKLFRGGREVPKPTVTLCGMGNTSGCHGLAHQNRLHFRWVETGQEVDPYSHATTAGGHWERAVFDEPVDYLTALGRGEWLPLLGGGFDAV